MTEDRLGRVRREAAAVMAVAKHVRLDDDALARFAAALARDPLPRPRWDPALHHVGDDASRLAFVVTWNCVNFGSGWFPKVQKRDALSGATTVMVSLKERFDRHGAWPAEALAALDAATLAPVIGQDLADPERAEIVGLWAEALRQLGRFLLDRFAGRFEALVSEAGGSASRLVDLLAEMSFYRDEAVHPGVGRVAFYKRAQITASDLALAFDGRGPGAFRDLDRLTMFADNLVPHVLRHFGVLVLDEALAARIEREEPIPSGGVEEIEIRAGGVHAVERLCARLAELGHPIPARTLDAMLWTRGQDADIKARPRHRARSVYY